MDKHHRAQGALEGQARLVSAPLRYPVPWEVLRGLTPHLLQGTVHSVDAFSAGVVGKMSPAPEVTGWQHLPQHPRFLLVANHYQRPGLWILHSASVLTQAVRRHYGSGDPPVRWVVTANWPAWRIGPWRFASPGDPLLRRVAHALCCYPVSFAGSNPQFTAHSIRRILKEARHLTRPIGLFPEGVAGVAGQLHPPLPGVDRLIAHLAKTGMPAVPAGISEDGRFLIRFGPLVPAADLTGSADPAALLMERIAQLL